MESYNVKTCVPELLELSSERVELMPEGMQMVEREPSMERHLSGLQALCRSYSSNTVRFLECAR